VFARLAELGGVAEDEMFRTFNMGIGMCAVVPADQTDAALETLREAGTEARVIGEIVQSGTGDGQVVYG
jgi:phosphoribosylformylglycinamidine cyclo-ligase